MIIFTLAVAVLAGVHLGTGFERQRALESAEVEPISPTAVAVVNSDTGVLVDGENLNYSAAIIETLGEGFVLVSPAMAQNGLEQGTYSAILTFPSNVSTRIVAFNSGQPERVQLEFRVNPNLPESRYIMTHLDLLTLQIAINMTIANTYVSSLFSQFHIAQDQMGIVFRNTEDKIDALEVVHLEDFTPDLQLESLPDIKFEPEEVDTSEHFDSVTDFAENVSEIYSSNFELAAATYTTMREIMESLTEGFPQDRENWVNEVNDWLNGWLVFNYDVQDHLALVTSYQDFLYKWHQDEALPWQAELELWQNDLETWENALTDWFDDINENGSSNGLSVKSLAQISTINSQIEAIDLQAQTFLNSSIWGNVKNEAVKLSSIDDITASADTHIAIFKDELSSTVNNLTVAELVFLAEWIAGFDLQNFILSPSSGAAVNTASKPPDLRPFNGATERNVPPMWDDTDEINIPPEIPADNEPPEPETLWNDIIFIHDLLNHFEIDDYMTPELWGQVDVLLDAYYTYLDFVRMDLSFQFMENVYLLFEVRYEYMEYLIELRETALESEYNARTHLLETLQKFFETVSYSGEDTYARLSDFVGMLPESRTAAGINQDLINFTIAPFDFITPYVRAESDSSTGFSSENVFALLLWAGIAVLLVFVVIAITLTAIEQVRRIKDDRITE